MRMNSDLNSFRRSAVGLDRLFDMLESGLPGQATENYPPFDLEQQDDDHFRITLAVAGFRPDEIDITTQQNLLVVSGTKNDRDERNYVHRGIATRSFERSFVLGDYVQVDGADMRDGLLSIALRREVPEEMKPRRISIGGGEAQSRITDQSSAQEESHRAAA